MLSVSVVIPTYNRIAFLQHSIDSVLNQNHQDFELIIVDDGSSDGTGEMLANKYREERIKYFFQDNRGPSAARNRGIREASCEFIAFLDSDDRFAPQKLELQISAMAGQPEFLISHTQEIWYRRGKLLNQKNKHRKESGNIFARCLELCAVGMSTTIVKKELFDKVGLFDEKFPCCEDYDFWLRTSIDHEFLLVDRPLTIKDGGRPDQLSWQHRIGMDQYRIRSIQKIVETGKLTPAQKELAVTELIKKCEIYGKGCLKHNKKTEGEKYLQLAKKYHTSSRNLNFI